MSIKIKSKNKLKVVLEDESTKKTKTFLLGGASKVPSEDVLSICQSFDEVNFVIDIQKFEASTQEEFIAHVNASGLDVARIKKLVEISPIKGFTNAESKAELVSNIVKSHNTEMSTKIVERMNDTETGKAVTDTIGNSVHPDKGRSYEESEIAAKNIEFSNAIGAFLTEFKENYLSAYFNDLKTMEPEVAKDYLKKKLSALSDALVSNFQKQYLNHVSGKDYKKQVELAKEREERSNIITEKVIVMLGEVLAERKEQIESKTTETDEATLKNLEAASNFLNVARGASERVKEWEERNRAALEGRKEKINGAAEAESTEAMDVTGKYDKSKKRKEIIDDFFKASSELEELMYVFHSLVIAHPEFGTEGNPSINEEALNSDGKYKEAKEAFDAHKSEYKTFEAYMKKIIGKKGDSTMMSNEEVAEYTSDINRIIEELKEKNKEILENAAYAKEIKKAHETWETESRKKVEVSEMS